MNDLVIFNVVGKAKKKRKRDGSEYGILYVGYCFPDCDGVAIDSKYSNILIYDMMEFDTYNVGDNLQCFKCYNRSGNPYLKVVGSINVFK